jgi:ubiquinone/menaquinone biosynthesis C-methylase UbiE
MPIKTNIREVSDDAQGHLNGQRELWSDPAYWKDQEELWASVFVSPDSLSPLGVSYTEEMWIDVIHPRIKDYLKGEVLEVAPGRGRVTNFLTRHLNVLDSLELVDQSEYCIEYCRKEFGNNLKYHVNNGTSLNMIENNSKDFVFSWDSFVHMDKEVINHYLSGFFDVLKKGGHGFIHHSYFYGNENPKKNRAGRSNMDFDLFAELLVKNNLKLVNQEMFKLNVESYTLNDGFTTFVKV